MGDKDQLKVFTREEANQIIPRLTSLIRELQSIREEIIRREVGIDAMELVSRKDESGYHSGLDKELSKYNRSISRFYALVDEVHQMGCFLKDVDFGLVDFFTLYKGRVVYLCWRLGEPEVTHWHEVGLGYAHRQPLETHPKDK